MKLFHITKRKYLQSILKNGLRINSGKTGFCGMRGIVMSKKKYNMQPLFLTDNIDSISELMLSTEWIDENDAIVIEINDENINTTNLTKGNYDNEFIYYNDIPACKINLIDIKLK